MGAFRVTPFAAMRAGLVAVLAAVAILAAATAIALHWHGRASGTWTEFSIGPASGQSLSITQEGLRGDGATLVSLLAIAYEMPTARIIAPPWLAQTRYAIAAAVKPEDVPEFPALLQGELKRHLRLEMHRDTRPFDAFVLTASANPRLEAGSGMDRFTWIGQRQTRLHRASMRRLADALQSILGCPVIDETRLDGAYDMQFGWDGNPAVSITRTLRDRFGLVLTPARRDIEVLVVDGICRDPALFVLSQAGRLARGAPAGVRRHLSSWLTVQ